MSVYYEPAFYTRLILQMAGQEGLKETELLESARIDPSRLESPFSHIPYEKHESLLVEVVKRSGNWAIPLKTGMLMTRLDYFDIFGYAIMSHRNLGEALEFGINNLGNYNNTISVELIRETDHAVYRFSPRLPPALGINLHTEFLMAHGLTVARGAVGNKDLSPMEVKLRHEPYADEQEYQTFFKSSISFNQSEYAMVIPLEWLSYPCVNANPALSNLLSTHMREILKGLPNPRRLRDVVKKEIHSRLGNDTANLEEISARLGFKPRTLQQYLKDEGTTFNRLIDETRGELVENLLKDSDLTINEIAFRLGYKDASSFHRWFHKKFNHTPQAHREKQQGKGS